MGVVFLVVVPTEKYEKVLKSGTSDGRRKAGKKSCRSF